MRIPAGLYAITDDKLLHGRLSDAVAAALAGGCRLVQYRSKREDAKTKLAEARALKQRCDEAGAMLLINDDVELAQAVGAHGVHLGQSDTALASARDALGPEAIIGITCHDQLSLAEQAAANGADYLAFGRFFPSNTKPGAAAAKLDVLTQARARFVQPITGIGGITLDNAAAVLAAGADNIAVVGGLFDTDSLLEIERRARAFCQLSLQPHASLVK